MFLQRVALHDQALKNGGGDCLFFSQRRQTVLGVLTRLSRCARLALGLTGRNGTLAQLRDGLKPRFLRLFPAAIEQQTFGLAQLFPDFTITGRLACLTGQLAQLRRQLFQHIVDAQQILLCAFKLKLGLMPPLIQTRDTSRLFQNAAARLGFGIDQFRNLALPHQGGRMGTCGCVSEQHLHVACAHLFGANLVGAADIARDPPHDFEVILVVERRRGQTFGVIDQKSDLGEVSGGTGRSTGKDHVFHSAAAHRLGAVFAHNPAQSL